MRLLESALTSLSAKQALLRALGLVGWLGLVLIVLIAVIANHTGKLLVRCLHAVPQAAEIARGDRR